MACWMDQYGTGMAPSHCSLTWDLRPSSQAEAACRLAGRDLAEDARKAYLADLGPYRSTCGFGID